MAANSDLAQKLINDLRLRKERMAAAAAHTTTKYSNQSTRANSLGNSGKSYRGAQQINGSGSSRTGNPSRSGGTHSSDQIVLYDKEHHNTRQIQDLSMAISFALENGGKLCKIDTSSSNPLVNFINGFTRGSMEGGKLKITGINKQGFTMNQFPRASRIHITEIAKGVQQVNEILRVCSSRRGFDRNSVEIWKELLKGAIHLEESLRMLVDQQKGTGYNNRTGQKGRIQLLEDDEDQDDNQMQLALQTICFKKPSINAHGAQHTTKNNVTRGQLFLSNIDETFEYASNSKLVPQRRSAGVTDFNKHPTEGKNKGRISNVVAKLMGLELLHQDDYGKEQESSSKGAEGNERKDGNLLNKYTKLPESLNPQRKKEEKWHTTPNKHSARTTNTTSIRNTKVDHRAGNNQEGSVGNFKMASSERKMQRGDLKILPGRVNEVSNNKIGMAQMHKQQNQINKPSQVVGFLKLQKKERKRSSPENGERILPEVKQSKLPNHERLQKLHQNNTISKGDALPSENTEFNVSAHAAKRNGSNDLPSKQNRFIDKYSPIQIHMVKKPEQPEGRRLAAQKKLILKQNQPAKTNEKRQMEKTNSAQTDRQFEIMQKLKSVELDTPGNGKMVEKYFLENLPNNECQDSAPILDISQNISTNQEDVEKEGKNQKTTLKETKNEQGMATYSHQWPGQEIPKDVLATPRAISTKVQKIENPLKINVLTAKQSGTVNQLSKSLKDSANILENWKQKVQNKNSSFIVIDQQIRCHAGEAGADSIMPSSPASEENPSKQIEKLQNEAKQIIMVNISVGDDHQKQKLLELLTPNDKDGDNIASTPGNVSDDCKNGLQPSAFGDAQVLRQDDQKNGGHKENIVSHTFFQHRHKQYPSPRKLEPLTEHEKKFKEMAIKSHQFLNTAEALFKLNIPVSFLHAGDHNDEPGYKKLVVDCGCEVMKRKAKRHQAAYQPYKNTTMIISLDDLIKQLCKDLKMLKLYGGNGSDVAAHLHKMVDKDIHNPNSDVNSMWDYEWNKMTSVNEVVIIDVEKHVVNELLNEITNDLTLVTALA